jgi:hypothetical protein
VSGFTVFLAFVGTSLANFIDFLFSSLHSFPLNPKWVLCDKGWKAIWDKLTASTQRNVDLSIDAWYPPKSGLRERIESIHEQYPEGFQSDVSGKKKGTQAWDEAEIALDRYQRIQRAKRKLWVVLCWISVVQQSQKKVRSRMEQREVEEDPVDKKMEDSICSMSDDQKSRPCRISFQDNDAPAPTEAEIIGMSSLMTHLGRAQSDEPRMYRRRSSASAGDKHFENIEVIDSLLDDSSLLSATQSEGLQRIRTVLVNQQAPNPVERRHAKLSFDGMEMEKVCEGIPSFILKEYGGAKFDSSGNVKKMFKTSVLTMIAARRFIGHALDGLENVCCSKFVPAEWTKLSRESKEELAEILSFKSLASWDFNVVELAKLCNGNPLLFVGWAVIGSPHAQQAMAADLGVEPECQDGYDFVSNYEVKTPTLCSFLRVTESDYIANAYHNNTHAADVLQTLNTILQLGGDEFAHSSLDIFSLLVAAAIHDVKHPGELMLLCYTECSCSSMQLRLSPTNSITVMFVAQGLNNNFQVNSRSELAVQYNDVSVLENYSLTWFYQKLLGPERDSSIDIFSGLNKQQFSVSRSIIVKAVLDTDMTHHFSMMKRISSHKETLEGKSRRDWLTPYTSRGCSYSPSMDMLTFLLHLSDISNPAKPLFEYWTDRILEECYAQGDKEASLSLPISPLCDRATTSKKQCQIGFIKFVVKPAYDILGEIIPAFGAVVSPYIQKSELFWEEYEDDVGVAKEE